MASVFLQFLLIEFWSVSSEISRFAIRHELMQSTNFDSHWFKVWSVSSEISRFAIWLKKEPNSTWFDGRFQYIFEFWYLSSEISRFPLPAQKRTCSDSWIFRKWILSRFSHDEQFWFFDYFLEFRVWTCVKINILSSVKWRNIFASVASVFASTKTADCF